MYCATQFKLTAMDSDGRNTGIATQETCFQYTTQDQTNKTKAYWTAGLFLVSMKMCCPCSYTVPSYTSLPSE